MDVDTEEGADEGDTPTTPLARTEEARPLGADGGEPGDGMDLENANEAEGEAEPPPTTNGAEDTGDENSQASTQHAASLEEENGMHAEVGQRVVAAATTKLATITPAHPDGTCGLGHGDGTDGHAAGGGLRTSGHDL